MSEPVSRLFSEKVRRPYMMAALVEKDPKKRYKLIQSCRRFAAREAAEFEAFAGAIRKAIHEA